MIKQDDKDILFTLEHWFNQALEQPIATREKWLIEQCPHHPEQVQHVLELLASHEQADTFLAEPATATLPIPIPDFTGRVMGAYKIEQLIGKGGMGHVYLARRNDGEFQKKVAIKFVEAVEIDDELFKRERQILADIQIPNVVTLLDGGTFEQRYPYIVMEYVDGVALDVYVRQSKLNQEDIIRLLINVAMIVQKANNRGIIHCDLKPSNILVTADGTLKLLDFGISRLTRHANHQHHHAATHAFEESLRKALTPEYASPQRCQNQLPAITDDVYSLGIIMGCLLTQQQPALIGKINTAGNKKQQGCYANTNVLSKRIQQTELKAIFNKATAKNAEQRYPSAQALANDLQHKLDNKCVSVCQHRVDYRIKKRLQQHWPTLMAFTLLLALLVTVPLMLYKHKQMQRNITEANQFITDLIDNITKDVNGYQASPLLRKTQLQHAITQAKNYDSIGIKTSLAHLYSLMGEVSGHPYAIAENNLAESKQYYETSLQLFQQLLTQRKNQVKAYEDYLHVKRQLAIILGYEGEIEQALTMLTETRETLKKVYKTQRVPLAEHYPLGVYAMIQAFGYIHVERYPQAQALLKEAEHYFSLALNKSSADYVDNFTFLAELQAHVMNLQGDKTAAKKHYHTLIASVNQHKNASWKISRSLGRAYQSSGCLLLAENEHQQALTTFLQAKAIYVKLATRYIAVPSLEQRLKEFAALDNSSVRRSAAALRVSMNCANPRRFIIPPRLALL